MELERVIAIVADVLDMDEDKITADSKFLDDLQADSLDIAEIILQLEDAYGIEILDEEAKPNMTVGEVAEKLENALN